MAGPKVISELNLKLTADVAELNKKLKEANSKIDNFTSNASKTVGAIKTSTLAVIGAITGVVASTKQIFESTQTSGDLLEKKIAGIKGVAQNVAESLATLDFSVSLKDAKKSAEDLAEIIDDLGDRKRSIEIISAKNTFEVSKLKGQLRDTTISEEKRLEISKRIQEIAQEEFTYRKQYAEEALAGENQSLVTKYNITKDQADLTLQYVQDYAKYSKTQLDALNKAMEAQSALDKYYSNNSINIEKWGADEKLVAKYQQDILNKTALVTPELRKYIALWQPINRLTDKHKDSIAQISIDWYNANKEIQSFLNPAEKVENKLNNLKESNSGKGSLLGIPAGPTSNANEGPLAGLLNIPTKNIDFNKLKTPANTFTESWKDAVVKMGDITDSLAGMFRNLGNTIAQASEDGKVSFSESMNIMAQSALSLIPVLQSLAVAGMISKESMKGIVGIATAIAGIATIFSLFGAYTKPKKLADGGIAYGSSFVNVGEYSNARSNPEVIAPLSKLQSIMGAKSLNITVDGKISGKDLALVLRRADTSN